YGGITFDNETTELVNTFDPQSNSWGIPNMTGNIPIRKRGSIGIIDHNERMYLWGGFVDNTYILTSSMIILDTINFSWKIGNLNSAPTVSSFYGATLLPNNKIIYIGS